MGQQNQSMNGEEMEDDGDDGEDAPISDDMVNDTKEILAMASQI